MIFYLLLMGWKYSGIISISAIKQSIEMYDVLSGFFVVAKDLLSYCSYMCDIFITYALQRNDCLL